MTMINVFKLKSTILFRFLFNIFFNQDIFQISSSYYEYFKAIKMKFRKFQNFSSQHKLVSNVIDDRQMLFMIFTSRAPCIKFPRIPQHKIIKYFFVTSLSYKHAGKHKSQMMKILKIIVCK